MQKSSLRTAIRMIIFGLLVALLFVYLNLVFTFPRSRINEDTNGDYSRERFNSFYAQEDNIVDCVFLGTSGTDRYWMPAFAWKDKGIATIELTTPSQQIMFSKYIIKESLKTQNPKLFVLDLRMTIRHPKKTNNEITRRVTDNMRRSRNWLETVINCRKLIKKAGGKPERLLTYLYPPFKFHSMWPSIKLDDLTVLFPENEYMGYFGTNFIYDTIPQEPTVVTDQTVSIPKENLPLIDDLLDYCKSLDAEVIFISTPMNCDAELQGQLNFAQQYIEDEGFKVYNFNTDEMYDSVGWDFDTDQYNRDHANFRGAVKFTRYLEDILVNEYGLTDHRNDDNVSVYADWEKGFDNTMAAAEYYMPEFHKQLADEFAKAGE